MMVLGRFYAVTYLAAFFCFFTEKSSWKNMECFHVHFACHSTLLLSFLNNIKFLHFRWYFPCGILATHTLKQCPQIFSLFVFLLFNLSIFVTVFFFSFYLFSLYSCLSLLAYFSKLFFSLSIISFSKYVSLSCF